MIAKWRKTVIGGFAVTKTGLALKDKILKKNKLGIIRRKK